MTYKEIFKTHPIGTGEGVNSYCRRIAEYIGKPWLTVKGKFYRHNPTSLLHEQKTPVSDKKEGEVHWKDYIEPIQQLQKVFSKASNAQDYGTWQVEDEIAFTVLGDFHLGSWATDYELFQRITEEILETDGLYVVLVGDLIQMAIGLRNVLEQADNALPPLHQMYFVASWLNDIKHKVICSTWDNHSVMREEKAVGYSMYSEIFSRTVMYHKHIGHTTIRVGDIDYNCAFSHKWQGRSMYNPIHGQMRYIREHASDRDLVAGGDSHRPGFGSWYEGGIERVGINCGSLQTNSGYAKRHFTLKTFPVFPCIKLNPKEKIMTPYRSVRNWLGN